LTDKVAVVAHYSEVEKLSRSVQTLILELKRGGYAVLLVSAVPGDRPLPGDPEVLQDVTVLRRPNVGYDFGSWGTALARYPDIERARQVLLVNDSLVGPFGSIGHVLRAFDDVQSDVWGLTDSLQRGHHLQSYVLGFKNGVLAHPQLRSFWQGIRVEPDKREVIRRYELGLGQLLRRNGWRFEALYPHEVVGVGRHNPAVLGWRRLLDLGLPFVKREVLVRPVVARDAARVQEEIRERFAADVREWL
jgi:lipopolysaccharide biosynthesis protein